MFRLSLSTCPPGALMFNRSPSRSRYEPSPGGSMRMRNWHRRLALPIRMFAPEAQPHPADFRNREIQSGRGRSISTRRSWTLNSPYDVSEDARKQPSIEACSPPAVPASVVLHSARIFQPSTQSATATSYQPSLPLRSLCGSPVQSTNATSVLALSRNPSSML